VVGAAPERVVLEGRGGSDARPPVRIFLGSEPAQQRAERVFVWSVEQARDPARRYEITLLKGLPGFRQQGWTTGFSNYRYAIPHLCEGRGRAIYNDVDQIYCADPGELFDTELSGHGYLAVAVNDPSVMLLDCQRMAPIWTLERAQREAKKRLIERAREAWGPLSHAWNVRDDDVPEGDEKCLHYTTLHTQPWRPFPEKFSYHGHPRGERWFELERSADAAGFHAHDRTRPSRAYVEWLASQTPDATLRGAAETDTEAFTPPAPGAAPPMPCEERVAGETLASLPDSDLDWVLDDLFASATRRVRLELPWDGTSRGSEHWRERVDAASRRAPKLAWQIALRATDGRQQVREGGAWQQQQPPSVWVLEDDRPGNRTQSLGLAEALSWPFEEKRLVPGPASRLHNRWLGASLAGIDASRSSALEPPWPDLVIAAGRRTAPVARWVREQSGGRTRLVMLGRKGGDDADLFDLVFTPSYCRLPAHPRRVETLAPLHRVTPASIARARERFADPFAELPGPRLALLVGGTSGQYFISPRTAARLGEQAMRAARDLDGSLLVTTSRRLSQSATRALVRATRGAALVHTWRPDDPDNPYQGLLAWADALVITADSESMLAEACSLGKPVFVAPLPIRASFPVLSFFREWVWQRSYGRPPGPRGTPRPQRGLEHLCARAIERGFSRPTRDLDRLHRALFEHGAARPFDADVELFAPAPFDDCDAAVEKVRILMGTS
jgi:mitochondrial fission protein ELM1